MNMQKVSLFFLLPIFLLSFTLFVFATQEKPDTVLMNSKVYEEHKMALVTFPHKKHAIDTKLACIECHHVYKDGKNTWKEGDIVQKCESCHSKAKANSDEAAKMSKQEKIAAFHYTAIHQNCRNCHKQRKSDNLSSGPTSCKQCHIKKEESQ